MQREFLISYPGSTNPFGTIFALFQNLVDSSIYLKAPLRGLGVEASLEGGLVGDVPLRGLEGCSARMRKNSGERSEHHKTNRMPKIFGFVFGIVS